MKTKQKLILLSIFSGAFGGFMGAVSGSNSRLVVSFVSAFFGGISAWGFSGTFNNI